MKPRTVLLIFFSLFSLHLLYCQTWRALPGGSGGTDGEVSVLYHDSTYLWIGGSFTHAGGMSVQNVVRHNGVGYVATLGLPSEPLCFVKFKGKVYAGGRFTVNGSSYGLMRFDSTVWTPLMKITDGFGSVYAAVVYKNKLVVGGDFISITGFPTVRLAQFDGTTWSVILSAGQLSGGPATIRTFLVDGTNLYIGGDFPDTNLSFVPACSFSGKCISWDGTKWSALPVDYNTPSQVRSLFKYQNALWCGGYLNNYLCCPYTSGSLSGCAGMLSGSLTSWNHWNPVGGGIQLAIWAAMPWNGYVYAGGTTGGTSYPSGASRLWMWDGSNWNPDANFVQQGVPWTVSVRTMEKNPTGATLYIGGQFTVNGAYNIAYAGAGSALPVTLTSFSGSCVDGQIALVWQTALEINNERFDVEYAPDGEHFDKVGEVAGHGNTTTIQRYTWTDSVRGVGYYRLQQVDYNQQKTPSDIVAVSDCFSKEHKITIFPTCATRTISVTGLLSTTRKCEIYTMQSQKILSMDVSPGNMSIDISALPSGSYLLVTHNSLGEREVGRFFKL
jgi:hypothetical protein